MKLSNVWLSLLLAHVAWMSTSRAEMVTTPAAPREVPAAGAKYSFTDSIETFTEDYMFKPKWPFELVPGKDPNGWTFVLEPYVWATGLQGKSAVKGLPAANVSFSPKTVLQNLDWGIFARGEVRKGRWGVIADGFFAQLSGSQDPDGKFYSSANLVVQQSMVELALAYRVLESRFGFVDLYAGARYNYIGLNLDLKVNDAVANEIGVDVAANASAKIDATVRSDVSNAVQASLPQIQAELASTDAAVRNAVTSAVRTGITDAVTARVTSDVERDLKLRLIESIRPDRVGDRRDRGGRRDRGVRGGPNLLRDVEITRVVRPVREAYTNYVRAEVTYRVAAERSRLAAAAGVLSAEIVNAENTAKAAANKAKGDLADAVASSLENKLGGSASGSQWWVDPIFGVRAQLNFTRWLYLNVQGDVGGFDTGSNIAWFAQAALGVNFSRNIFGELGYRYTYTDYTNNGFLYQMNQYGIFAGLGVKF